MQLPELIFVTKAARKPAQCREDMVPPHRHNNTEFVLYTKGGGTTLIGGIEYDFSEGSVAVINQNTLHSEVHNVCGEVIYFNITGGGADMITDGLYKPGNFAVLKKIALNIYRESRAPQYSFKMLLSAMTGEFLALMARELVTKKYNGADIERAQDYLKSRCCERLDMKAVAEMYGFGYESFRHKFKKICGMSPKEYVIYNRLLCSCDLLGDTEKPCTEVALECGFSDSAQFSKMFRQRFGMMPTEYRRNNRA